MPYQLGFGVSTILLLCVHSDRTNGPEETMSAASAQLVALSGTGVSSHMAVMSGQ